MTTYRLKVHVSVHVEVLNFDAQIEAGSDTACAERVFDNILREKRGGIQDWESQIRQTAIEALINAGVSPIVAAGLEG